jgi:hypothetical protein
MPTVEVTGIRASVATACATYSTAISIDGDGATCCDGVPFDLASQYSLNPKYKF